MKSIELRIHAKHSTVIRSGAVHNNQVLIWIDEVGLWLTEENIQSLTKAIDEACLKLQIEKIKEEQA